MNNKDRPKDIKHSFIEKIKRKEKRKLRAQRKKGQAIWFGLGLFGVIGWSVMVPTLIGIAVGIWADRKWPSQISWTLTFLFIGIILGCLNAWYWVEKERKLIEEENEE
ncbi:MAG: AtpZ/AtpI family protein [Candidatus Atribacteria bacterium]